MDDKRDSKRDFINLSPSKESDVANTQIESSLLRYKDLELLEEETHSVDSVSK